MGRLNRVVPVRRNSVEKRSERTIGTHEEHGLKRSRRSDASGMTLARGE